MASTRELLLVEGMRLFGEKGYTATSVAQIEQAAGLSPGSGSLYKHFRSKEELLSAGLDRLLASGEQTAARIAARQSAESGTPAQDATQPDGRRDADGLTEQLRAIVEAGLQRMDEDRDLSRLLFRGLDAFPAMLERFGQGEIARLHQQITAMLGAMAGDDGATEDWAAVALVLQGTVAHYWLLADLYGHHPTRIDKDRFIAATAALTAALVNPHHCPTDPIKEAR